LNKPIGIFDSGVGGLTVAAAIKRVLPNESFVYFGDTINSPYGNKSAETILYYSEQIARFLVQQNCKAIVIACNTASALAYQQLTEMLPNIPILNVVDPVVDYVGSSINNKVGVIATRATIKSGIYRKKLRKLNKKLHVVSAPTPLLVSIIEEGFVNTKVSASAVETYLGSKKFSDISTLILGCTHFPLLQKEIEQFFGGRAEVIDSPELVARQLLSLLKKNNLLQTEETTPVHRFYVSEHTEAFERTAKVFFGNEIELIEQLPVYT
jgi:glutamate racemase